MQIFDRATADLLILTIFVAVYAGMALGRWPALRTDRTGIAIMGAALVLLLAPDRHDVLATVDVGALCVLFGLMVVSAQVDAAGVYGRVATWLGHTGLSDARLLGAVVLVTGLLSSVLANDVIVFAMTPVLCRGLIASGRNPAPFLLAHAGAANAGSAATLLGNPQNIIIGEAGGLDFWWYALSAAPAALLALAAVHLCVLVTWRGRFRALSARGNASGEPPEAGAVPAVDRSAALKAGLAVTLLLAMFATPLPRWLSALLVAGAVLISRHQSTRSLLGRVDWQLLALFAGLFVVTGAVAPMLAEPIGQAAGALAHDRVWLAVANVLGSNTIGNVPFVMLVLSAFPALAPETLRALAILSTLAGNFFIVGSLANIIVAERAKGAGVVLGFADFARAGVPMTVLGLGLALGYLNLIE